MDNYQRLLEDFKVFLWYIWKHLNLPEPTPVQYQIADYLQHGPKRQIIEGFRGVGKSWITSAFVLWCLLRDPQEKILVVSASKSRSDDFSTFTLSLIKDVPLLQHLEPKQDQRQSKIAFDVGPAKSAHAPSVKSVGIFGQMTGSRATRIIADDVEVPKNSFTQDMRDKLLKTVSEFEAIIVPNIGRITYLGTPQTEESVYNKLREKGYSTRIWPARYPTTQEADTKYEGCLAPKIYDAIVSNPKLEHNPTDPKRFNALDLIEREASYGRSGFALQFMLDTSLSDADRYPLKTSDLIVTNLHRKKAPVLIQYGSGREQLLDIPTIGFTGDRWYEPMHVDSEWAKYEGSVMAIDPSGRGKDETTWAIVKQLHGMLFLMECSGMPGGYDEKVLTALAQAAKRHKVNEIIIESNFGDGMFTSLLQPVLQKIHSCKVEEVRHNIQKEKRIIDVLEPILNQHRLIVDELVVKMDLKTAQETPLYSLFYQLTRITKERGALKHDDRLDALAMAVAFWVEAMARDEGLSAEAYREQLLDEELEKFMNHVLDLDGDYLQSNSGWINTERKY